MRQISAELIGAVFGDGSVCKHDYEIRISLGKKDKEYANYLAYLLTNLGLKPKIDIKRTNEIWIRVWNKIFWLEICKWFQPGKKCIKKIPKNMKEFIKGVFDIDGSVHLDKRKYPVISIRGSDEKILRKIQKYLSSLKITSSLFGPETTPFGGTVYKLRVYGIKNCKKWLEKIGSSNPRKREILENALQSDHTVRGES
jgi:intein-encoded DNA endonuclease-like protein